MSRPVSPLTQGYESDSAHEHRPSASGPCIPEEDGSSPSEERHEPKTKQRSRSRSRSPASNAAKTYIRSTSESIKATIYKFKSFIRKNETVRRTYWTAVVLGLITTVYYICGLFFEGRGNSIAVRGTLIAEQSKNTTESIAVAGFIINCHNMRVSRH
jgi:hypothetical protein